MSLLMKALQQAAQNRGDHPVENAAGAVTPEAFQAGEAAAPGAALVATGRPVADEDNELSLEPIEPGRDNASPGHGLPATAAARDRGETAAPDAPGRLPQRPGDSGQAPAAATTPLAATPRTPSYTGGGSALRDPADASAEPGWNNPAAPPASPGRGAAGGIRQGTGSRSAGSTVGSSERAAALLAAGAGAAKPGRLSQVTRLQWIVLAGLGAGLVMFAYFYVQIAHPGLMQRGLRSTQLLAQPPGMVPAAATSPMAYDDIPGDGPAVGLIATDGSRDASASTVSPMAGTDGSQVEPPSIPMIGVPPAQPTVARIPEALSSSPLLNPGPQADATQAGLPGPSSTRERASAARETVPSAVPSTAPSATAAQPTTRTPINVGTTIHSEPPGRGVTRLPAAAGPEATAGTASPVSPGNRRDRAARPLTEAPGIQVTRGSAVDPVNPTLGEAWDHLQAGRTDAAQVLYQKVAAGDPRNIDALLGLAAIAQLGNQNEAATRQYLRVLELDPRNAHAQASLIGLLGRADPVAAESQLKVLIGRDPTPFLYFTLGNLYADQNRWPLAQQAFFQAHHLQPGNADYAFNLAVGLERIAQPKLALSYLRTAVGLADAGARANFDLAAARKREAELESVAGSR